MSRPETLDPRGVRFAAGLTTAVFIAVLVTGAGWLALAQAVVFALTAARPTLGPYGLLFRFAVAPRLGPPSEREPAAPVRFSQLLGLVFAAVAGAAYLAGWSWLGAGVAGAAMIVAFRNAAFGRCLGCDLYVAARRLTHRRAA